MFLTVYATGHPERRRKIVYLWSSKSNREFHVSNYTQLLSKVKLLADDEKKTEAVCVIGDTIVFFFINSITYAVNVILNVLFKT